MFIEALNELVKSNKDEAEILLRQFRKQRDFFFSRRIAELNPLYSLTEQEEQTLQAFFFAAGEQSTETNDSYVSYRVLSIFKTHKTENELVDDHEANISILGWLRMYWSSAWKKFAENNKYVLSARYALIQDNFLVNKDSSPEIALEELIEDLKHILPRAEKDIGLPIQDNDRHGVDEIGVLNIDRKTLLFFKQSNIGHHSKAFIEEFSSLLKSNTYDAHHRSDVWGNPLYFSRQLAILRWQDRIKDYIKKRRERPAALSVPIYQQIVSSLRRDGSINESCDGIIDSNGKKLLELSSTAAIDIVTAKSILRNGVPLLSSITAHHVWRWQLLEVHKQFVTKVKNPRLLVIDGGYKRLGELSGAGISNDTATKIRNIIFTQASCRFSYKGRDGIWTGNLISFDHWEARGQKTSLLELEMRAPLCPGFVEQLPIGGIELQEQRHMLPVVRLPIFVGRPNDHGSQASFQMEMHLEERARARESYERGGILLSDEDLLELANKAQMSARLVRKVMDAWLSEGYVEKIDDCVYTIGPRYPEAREMIKKAGQLEIDGQIRGQQKKKRKYQRLKTK
jgi:hypothetical protein